MLRVLPISFFLSISAYVSFPIFATVTTDTISRSQTNADGKKIEACEVVAEQTRESVEIKRVAEQVVENKEIISGNNAESELQSPAEEYRDMIEREQILADIDEEVPQPVFDKPSTMMVWVRAGGIYILCKILDGKEWLMRTYQNLVREFKVVKNTL